MAFSQHPYGCFKRDMFDHVLGEDVIEGPVRERKRPCRIHLQHAGQERNVGIEPAIKVAWAAADVQLWHCHARQVSFSNALIDADHSAPHAVRRNQPRMPWTKTKRVQNFIFQVLDRRDTKVAFR